MSGSPTIRWGILGTARIARRRLIPAIVASANGRLAAIASRDAGRARAVADEAGIPLALGSYEALIGDPGVDAVYIPLPNHLHVPWAIRALEAGKHVLVEKPVGLDATGARELAAVAERHTGLVVMEAFMYRFHPRWRALRRMVQDGELGALRGVETHFSYHNLDPANVRNQSGIGGGALLDIGCYGVSVARWLFGREPTTVTGSLELDPGFGIDRLATGTLDFGGGQGTFLAATQLEYRQDVRVTGTEATVEVSMPFNPPDREPTHLSVRRGSAVERLTFRPVDQYREMVEAFGAAALAGMPAPTPLGDAVANMAVLDGVRAAAG